MSSAFGSLAFQSAREDIWVAMPARDSLATERPVPSVAGGLVAVDAAGLGAHHYDDVIYVQPADAVAWRAALGTVAALTLADVAYGDAVLVRLSDEQALLDRSLYALSARFLLTEGAGGSLGGGGAGSGLTGGGGDDGTGDDGSSVVVAISAPCWPAQPVVILHADTGYYGYSAAGEWLYTTGVRPGTPLLHGRWFGGRIVGVTTTGAVVPTIVWSWETGCRVLTNDAVGYWPVGALPRDSMQTTNRTLFYAVPDGVGPIQYGIYRCGTLGFWVKCWDAPSTNDIAYGAGGVIYDGMGGFSQDDTIWVAILDAAVSPAVLRVWKYNPILPESLSGTGASVATFSTVGSNAPAAGLMRGSEDGLFCLLVARVNAVWALYKVTASGAVACTGITFTGSVVMTDLIQRGTTWVGVVPGDGLYRSTDGAAWTRVYVGDCLRALPGALDEWWSARADAATLLRSTDEGATWTEIPYATAAQSGGGTPPVPTAFDAVLAMES